MIDTRGGTGGPRKSPLKRLVSPSHSADDAAGIIEARLYKGADGPRLEKQGKSAMETAAAWLKSIDLSFSQLVALLFAVVASYFSARFGASESRRQHKERVRIERLTAAGELIRSVHNFAHDLETIILEINTHESSDGQAGKDHVGFGKAALPDEVFRQAATLGKPILADLIQLAAAKHLGSESIGGAFEYADYGTAVNETRAWSAQLLIQGFELLNKIGQQAKIPLRFAPSIRQEHLAKLAGHRFDDISRTTRADQRPAA
jgi:hypothetical protein